MLKILSILRRPLNCLFRQGRFFRMNPLKNKFPRRYRRSVVLEDSKGFLGPEDLAGGGPPAEAPRMTEPLSFRQVRLASLQLLFLQFQCLGSESPIQPGRQQSQPEDDPGDGGDSDGAKRGDADGVRQVRWRAGGRETGGGHASVMHDGNGGTHQDSSGCLSPVDPLFLISKVKGNP